MVSGVVVVPPVGAFDTVRAERFVSDLVDGITRNYATIVVRDMTGLTMVTRWR